MNTTLDIKDVTYIKRDVELAINHINSLLQTLNAIQETEEFLENAAICQAGESIQSYIDDMEKMRLKFVNGQTQILINI